MFLITCPTTDTPRMVGVHAIREHANTTHGVLTVVACSCGGDVVLCQGAQVAHRAPAADQLTTSQTTAPTTPTLVAA